MHNYMTNGREEIKVMIRTDGQPTIANSDPMPDDLSDSRYHKVDGLAHTRECLQAALREIDRREAEVAELRALVAGYSSAFNGALVGLKMARDAAYSGDFKKVDLWADQQARDILEERIPGGHIPGKYA